MMATKIEVLASRPRGRPRTFDKQEELKQALALFWERGYEGIAELVGAMAVTPPALYCAFGYKVGLYGALLSLYSGGRYRRRSGRAFKFRRTIPCQGKVSGVACPASCATRQAIAGIAITVMAIPATLFDRHRCL
ncbi:TetR family transcriptional regulator [Rugamonas sp.]|uniref:TetR family transcriptional regulator n=1 Tax=Rugamonas sp. TaxID=1926287 RepID=UPI0025F73ED1|nr:TetR family transcriptional regulator [Rugamonas sp.]